MKTRGLPVYIAPLLIVSGAGPFNGKSLPLVWQVYFVVLYLWAPENVNLALRSWNLSPGGQINCLKMRVFILSRLY